MSKIKCPCKECICVPICRNKLYIDFISDCILIEKFLYGRSGYAGELTPEESKQYNINWGTATDIVNPSSWGRYPK